MAGNRTAQLRFTSGQRTGECVALADGSYVIGSDDKAQIACVDPEVEWSHARVYLSKGRYWIEDLQSMAGVRVNERPVLHKALSAGDHVLVGAAGFVFENGASVAAAAPFSPGAGGNVEGVPAELALADGGALQARSQELAARVHVLESELKRKRAGLNLAAESFVEQLERAKERIQKMGEEQARLQQQLTERDEQLAAARAELDGSRQQAQGQVQVLVQRLESVRRDFEEMDRVLRAKARAYAKLIADTRLHLQPHSAPGVAASDDGAQQSAVAGEDEAAKAKAAAVAAAAALFDPEDRPPPVVVASSRLGNALRIAAVFLVLGLCGGLLFLLLTRPLPNSEGTTRAPVLSGKGAATAPQPGQNMPKVTARRAPLPAVERAQLERAVVAPAEERPQAEVAKANAGEQQAFAKLLEQLKGAHQRRDDAAVREAENALVAMGRPILVLVAQAFDVERQFPVKVSLHFIVLTLDGKASARELVDAMRSTSDRSVKLRLQFMLSKLVSEQDIGYMEAMVAAEPDPQIKKYLVKALGEAPGNLGLGALQGIVQTDSNMGARIEAIRAIQRKPHDASTTSFLMNVANSETDVSVRSTLLQVISAQAEREAVSFFLTVLQTDKRLNNRVHSAKYFERVGQPSEVALLEGVLQAETNHYVRKKLEVALRVIKARN